MKKFLLYFLSIMILTGCSNSESKKNVEDAFPLHLKVAEFKGVNQEGESFSLSKLKGEVWVANFIFTNCDTVCSPMTANLAELQRRLKDEGVQAELVSFSIDPDHDQPKELKNYANGVEADYANWNLLTGYKQEFIESFANKSFMAAAAKLEGSNQYVHSTMFYLVNTEGIVLQKYEGVDNPPYDQIIEDIKSVTAK